MGAAARRKPVFTAQAKFTRAARQSMKTQADILLVTVTKVESLAVLEAFSKHTGQKARLVSRGEKAYHDLGVVNGAHVWLVLSEMGAGGLGGAQQTATKAIEAIKPSAVIMVGIAFGVDEKKQAIGDILVSENLRLYDLQRVGTEDGKLQIILRGDRPHGSPWLLDAFKNADLHWHGAKVRFGCVLTGEKLVDNLDFRDQLRAFEPEAIGGEMEGAGLYTACQDAKVDWLLVKAICDWADGHKNRNKKKRQALAARNAAEFVLHTLRTVGLSRQNPKPKASRRKRQAGLGALVQIGGKAKIRGGVKVIKTVHGNVNL